VDALTDLLDGVRARGALFGQAVLDPPWSLRFDTGAPLTLATMLRGTAWVVPAGGAAVPIRRGDVGIVRGPAPHVVADDPATAPRGVVTSADYCAQADALPLDVRTCGTDPDGSALLLSGAYAGSGGISERLLHALPEVLVVTGEDGRNSALDFLAEEIVRDRPGQQVVLDRLLDLLLVATLRAWFDRPDARAPAWYRTVQDPVVDHALRRLHDDPARPWTVAGLATECGTSRAALARRFAAEVGEPPIAYLTGWRIAAAADLLRGTDATVGSIARKVGYANAFGFSVAFKRLRGVTPTEHRAAAAGP
jgi:AraC-like DNA-binding protein